MAGLLAAPNPVVTSMRAFEVLALMRLGNTERAEQAIAGLGEQEREYGEIRVTAAMLRLAQDDPRAATAALAPVLDGSAPAVWPPWLIQAFLVEAIARDALGDEGAAGRRWYTGRKWTSWTLRDRSRVSAVCADSAPAGSAEPVTLCDGWPWQRFLVTAGREPTPAFVHTVRHGAHTFWAC